MVEDYKRLGQILVDQGIVTTEQLTEAMREQEETGLFIGEILVSNGAASEDAIAKSLSSQLGFAYIDIENFLDKKINAFYKYQSQVKIGGRDNNSIRSQAEYRGSEVGKKFCEAYCIHRYLF